MDVYTVIAYLVRDGGHYVRTMQAPTPTEAVVRLRDELDLNKNYCEVVAVAIGETEFVTVDEKLVALAPYSPAQISETG